VVDTQI